MIEFTDLHDQVLNEELWKARIRLRQYNGNLYYDTDEDKRKAFEIMFRIANTTYDELLLYKEER